jgi:hypothetical protein
MSQNENLDLVSTVTSHGDDEQLQNKPHDRVPKQKDHSQQHHRPSPARIAQTRTSATADRVSGHYRFRRDVTLHHPASARTLGPIHGMPRQDWHGRQTVQLECLGHPVSHADPLGKWRNLIALRKRSGLAPCSGQRRLSLQTFGQATTKSPHSVRRHLAIFKLAATRRRRTGGKNAASGEGGQLQLTISLRNACSG